MKVNGIFDQSQQRQPDVATVSVVIPALNEARNLPFVLPHIPDWVHEVILVPGNSRDDTVDVARALLPGIRFAQQIQPGKGAALLSGLAMAQGDIVMMLDADGSTDPAEIPLFVNALLAGADYVKGTRYVQGSGSSDLSIIRSVGNAGLTALVRLLFNCQFTDLCYGYCGFWRRVAPRLNLSATGFEIETEMNIRALTAGLHIVEIASFESTRIYGSSNLHPVRDGLRVLRTILRERIHARTPAVPAYPVVLLAQQNVQEAT